RRVHQARQDRQGAGGVEEGPGLPADQQARRPAKDRGREENEGAREERIRTTKNTKDTKRRKRRKENGKSRDREMPALLFFCFRLFRVFRGGSLLVVVREWRP